ncbi:MAG: ammonium transporter [Rhodospirillales bacterium]|nr:ammonium transporter [Rhodospirillales bacterium]MBO6787654.1 ammonium transporter [Rhodospirillales bacterium]
MNFARMKKRTAALAALAAIAVTMTAGQASAEVTTESAFVFNTFAFLVHGVLVMFMAAGFAMLESGLVRSKNTATICLKNIALYSVAGIMFYLIGYNIMYVGVPEGGWMGTFSLFYNPGADELALINADEATPEMVAAVADTGYSVASDWFFQMVFVATAASIVSGTVAERIKFWPFVIFVVVLAAIIYPVQASWVWGGGWLAAMGFSDFAGSTLVHSTGGWAALTGAIILGARKGKYGSDGSIRALPGANIPLATLGTFILWFGWFGFNGGSQLALGSALDAAAMSIVYVNTNLAAAAGVVVAMILAQLIYKKVDVSLALNGAIGGLVAITAGPDLQNHFFAMIVGGIGGALVVFAVPMIDKMKIDDVVGAISAHLVAGIWGTLAVGIFGSGSIVTQAIGVVAIGVFVSVASAIVWMILKVTIGIRVSEEDEELGLDRAECGMEAYPEFGKGSQTL